MLFSAGHSFIRRLLRIVLSHSYRLVGGGGEVRRCRSRRRCTAKIFMLAFPGAVHDDASVRWNAVPVYGGWLAGRDLHSYTNILAAQGMQLISWRSSFSILWFILPTRRSVLQVCLGSTYTCTSSSVENLDHLIHIKSKSKRCSFYRGTPVRLYAVVMIYVVLCVLLFPRWILLLTPELGRYRGEGDTSICIPSSLRVHRGETSQS